MNRINAQHGASFIGLISTGLLSQQSSMFSAQQISADDVLEDEVHQVCSACPAPVHLLPEPTA